MDRKLVVVRGGGDIASGIIHRLYKSGYKVVVLEINKPTVIRRTVSFAQAIYDNQIEIEGVKAFKANDINEVYDILNDNNIPVVVDSKGEYIKKLNPFVLVDAILAKKNIGTKINFAPIVIGVGPGFCAGVDVHAVIESNRGHNLGKVILNGYAEANTGVPGNINGFSTERVIRSHKSGIVKHVLKIGNKVSKGDLIGYIDDSPFYAKIDGVLRGLIQEGIKVDNDFKIGDIDPRGVKEYCFTISDKARAIGGAVLEAILYLSLRM